MCSFSINPHNPPKCLYWYSQDKCKADTVLETCEASMTGHLQKLTFAKCSIIYAWHDSK